MLILEFIIIIICRLNKMYDLINELGQNNYFYITDVYYIFNHYLLVVCVTQVFIVIA